MSKGTLSNLLIKGHEDFHTESTQHFSEKEAV